MLWLYALIRFLFLCHVSIIFPAATTLTGLHFATTTLMTSTLRWWGYIQPSHLPLPELLKFVVFANSSIVGMNVSLMWNSVGFYQVTFLNQHLFFDLIIEHFTNKPITSSSVVWTSDSEVVYDTSIMFVRGSVRQGSVLLRHKTQHTGGSYRRCILHCHWC